MLPLSTVEQLAKEFKLKEEEIDSFVAATIEKIISEHTVRKNQEVFSGDEIKEIEDNLKGLGYIWKDILSQNMYVMNLSNLLKKINGVLHNE